MNHGFIRGNTLTITALVAVFAFPALAEIGIDDIWRQKKWTDFYCTKNPTGKNCAAATKKLKKMIAEFDAQNGH